MAGAIREIILLPVRLVQTVCGTIANAVYSCGRPRAGGVGRRRWGGRRHGVNVY